MIITAKKKIMRWGVADRVGIRWIERGLREGGDRRRQGGGVRVGESGARRDGWEDERLSSMEEF